MSAVAPADSTYAAIEAKIRRLTASPDEYTLPTAYLQNQINTFYSQDFPYAIKLDQMRDVYTFFTKPYVDRYPLDVNFNQGVRAPVYFDGIQGAFYKDRQQMFNLFPKWPTQFQQAGGVSGDISGATQANPCVITTSSTSQLVNGDYVTITGVVGMTQLNGNTYEIQVLSATTFSINVNSSLFTAYVSGGNWESRTSFNFYVNPIPFISGEVTIGGVYESGSSFSITDNGAMDTSGILYLVNPNPQVSVPAQNTNPAKPGMYNLNTQNPGLNNPTNIGSVNYVTGQFIFHLPEALAQGTYMTIWISQYTTGRPYTLLFWNNEFIIRPIPKLVHRVTVETYLTPVQFMQTTDNPILNQWWQYIAWGSAREIMRDRNDYEAVAMMEEGMRRQEALVLERQGVEEIGQRNSTIFTNTMSQGGWNQSWSQGGWW